MASAEPPRAATGKGRVATVPAGRPIRSAAATAGFTLVEMLVTLAILGLAAGLALQFAGGFGAGRHAQRLSEVIAGEIGLLRAEALRSGLTTRLAFDAGSGRFLSSRAGAVQIPTAPLPVRIETTETGGKPAEIRFLPDGGSSGGRIILGPPGGVVLTIGTLTARVGREAAR